MTLASTTPIRPRFGRIKDAVRYAARSRGRLYQLASEHPGLFRKDGASTLVDLDKLDEILNALPVANVLPPVHVRAKAQPELQPQPRRRRKRAA